MKKIAVSILKSNFDEASTIQKINETTAEFLHLDVMDGKFVINTTPVRNHLSESKKPIQVHLMVANPFEYIEKYSLNNTESIIIQSELSDDIDGYLDMIKAKGYKCGLAICPETKIDKVMPYIQRLDYVLVLTVEPGRGGQKLMENVLYKIDDLSSLRESYGYSYEIIVDGGVNEGTSHLVKNADILVSGAYICESDNFQDRIDMLR